MYAIIFKPKAENQFKKLPKSIQERILNVLYRIRIRPFSYDIKKLQGVDYYRIRIGEYRVIVDILQNEQVISIIEIGHRKNIYD